MVQADHFVSKSIRVNLFWFFDILFFDFALLLSFHTVASNKHPLSSKNHELWSKKIAQLGRNPLSITYHSIQKNNSKNEMLQSCAVRPSAGIQKPGPQEQKICLLGQDLCFGGVVHLGKTCEPGRWAPRGSCEPGRWAPRTNKSQIPVNVKTTVIGLSVYQLVTLMHQTISIVKWLLLLTNLPLNVQQANPLRTPFLPDGWKWPRRSLQ